VSSLRRFTDASGIRNPRILRFPTDSPGGSGTRHDGT